jgi:hypothetical protein
MKLLSSQSWSSIVKQDKLQSLCGRLVALTFLAGRVPTCPGSLSGSVSRPNRAHAQSYLLHRWWYDEPTPGSVPMADRKDADLIDINHAPLFLVSPRISGSGLSFAETLAPAWCCTHLIACASIAAPRLRIPCPASFTVRTQSAGGRELA